MLSKIIRAQQKEELDYVTFVPPSKNEIAELIKERNKKKERTEFIKSNKEDPVGAAQKKADEILSIAQEKYDSMVIEAKTLKIKAEEEIRLKLEEEFDAKLNEAVKGVSKNYMDSLEKIAVLKGDIYSNSEKKILELVFKIVGKIIDNEIQTNPEMVIDMLRKGFSQIKNVDKFEIRINPVDYDVLLRNKDKLGNIIKSGSDIKFIKSENIERGGCVIKTDMGEIITEPHKQLETIKNSVIGE